ncbi:MAG: radical SAM protein [Kosmotoga sp.]|uniref:radical SAM protein n=1 Tax=Kosmotoga sp. TaxID=1955248 RepID=UPI0025BEF4C0|nr:radical SAM protein [Kosmotoga sp.]MCD6159133.1 radical SAM protein [Kosmotoga sp.]
MKHVYGVVPSRRLGRSLGICPIPFKTCNYSCIYCQLGKTTRMTNSRYTFYSPEEILNEAENFIKKYGEKSFDVVTIVGEGEPTLYTPLDKIVEGIRKLTHKPLVLITNGSLLYNTSVRKEVSGFDIVMPTLDAWDEASFRKINRPFGKLSYKEVLKGIVDFSREFNGEIWLEVMLVKDYNDSIEALNFLKERIETISPERVYINVPVRPPAEKGVEIPEKSRIDYARRLLGATSIENLPVSNFLSSESDAIKAVIEIIKRHPMSKDDIKEFLLSEFNEQALEKFFSLASEKYNIEKCSYHGKVFYRYIQRREKR